MDAKNTVIEIHWTARPSSNWGRLFANRVLFIRDYDHTLVAQIHESRLCFDECLHLATLFHRVRSFRFVDIQ